MQRWPWWCAAVLMAGCGQSTPAATAGGATAVDAAPDGTAADVGSASDAGSSPDVGTPAAGECPQAKLLLEVAKGKGAGGNYPAAQLSGACKDGQFTVTSNGVPFYTYVAMTPNALQAVPHTWSIPTQPKLADKTTAVPMLGQAGFTVSGLPFYGPTEALVDKAVAQPAQQIGRAHV